MVGHNHPNGTPRPSNQDWALTDRLVAAGDIIGIQVLDHMIVTPTRRFFSFRRNSVLEIAEESIAR